MCHSILDANNVTIPEDSAERGVPRGLEGGTHNSYS